MHKAVGILALIIGLIALMQSCTANVMLDDDFVKVMASLGAWGLIITAAFAFADMKKAAMIALVVATFGSTRAAATIPDFFLWGIVSFILFFWLVFYMRKEKKKKNVTTK